MNSHLAVECSVCGATPNMMIGQTRGGEYSRCLSCGLESRVVPKHGSSRESFDAAQHDYHGEGSVFETPAIALIQRQFASARFRVMERYLFGGKLLEVGPGGGYLLEIAKAKGFEVSAVEHSEVLASRLHSRLGIAVICGMLEEVDVAALNSDIVVSLHVIEHCPEPRAHLMAARAVTARGGLLCLGTPNLGGWSRRLAGRRWPGYSTGHLHLFDKAVLSRLLTQTGWEVIGVHTLEHVMHWPRTLSSMRRRPQAHESPANAGAVIKNTPYGLLATTSSVAGAVSWPLRRLQMAFGGGYELLVVARNIG